MRRYLNEFIESTHKVTFGISPPPGFASAILLLIDLLLIGTLFYSKYEGWSYLDSLYFSVTTLATVGYGDLHPTTPGSKIFTIFYILFGVGIGFFILGTIAKSIMDSREKRIEQLERLLKIPSGEEPS